MDDVMEEMQTELDSVGMSQGHYDTRKPCNIWNMQTGLSTTDRHAV